ncbi:MAG TPA: SCO family protein [Opitutaceae bacterium]|nr:SCO family protein [Opitutaceae bacterium]
MRLILGLLLLLPAAVFAGDRPEAVGFEQRIGETVPLDTPFTGSDGMIRPLRAYLGAKPSVLIFDYFRCPEMCSLVSSGAIDALRTLRQSAGSDFTVITISIDPTDTADIAAVHRLQDIGHYGRPGAGPGWNTLIGTGASITALTRAAGFHYSYDPKSGQFAHPSGLIVLTPEGVISNYFMGIDFDSTRLSESLKRASANQTGDSVFGLVFLCFQGSGEHGRHWGAVWVGLSAAVAATVVALFGAIAFMLAQERRRVGKGTT